VSQSPMLGEVKDSGPPRTSLASQSLTPSIRALSSHTLTHRALGLLVVIPPRLPLGLCLQSWLLPWPTARSSPILNAAFGSHNRLKLRLPWALLILCPVPLSVTVAVPRSQLPLQLILSPQQ
jgi:hypothetical protein